MNFLKSLKSRSQVQITDKSFGSQTHVFTEQRQPSIEQCTPEDERKAEIFQKLSVGLARSVLQISKEEDVKQSKLRDKQIQEASEGGVLYGSHVYNTGAIRSVCMSIPPLTAEQKDKKMITEVFQQVETITKTQAFLRLASIVLPDGKDKKKTTNKEEQEDISNNNNNINLQTNTTSNTGIGLGNGSLSQGSFLKTQSSQQEAKGSKTINFNNNIKPQRQASQAKTSQKSLQLPPHEQPDPPNRQFFSLTAAQTHNNYYTTNNYIKQGVKTETSQFQPFRRQSQQQNNNSTGGNNNPISGFVHKKSPHKDNDNMSFSNDFSIEMPTYSRYRTFFFKPLDRENMFEGMKYIQYEQYVRKDNVMQNVMTIDLTKILSDKVYTLKTALADKPKVRRIFHSLRPQQRIELNKLLEETIALQDAIALFVLQGYRDSLEEVGIEPSPLEIHRQNRIVHLNQIFKSISREYYVEHIFNQIYEEDFQRKFMEQPMQEQYEILITIKRLLKTLCERISNKIEAMQALENRSSQGMHQQLDFEDESDFKEYLQQIQAIISHTKSIPSTRAVIEANNKQKQANNNNNNNNANKKRRKLLDDSSFESDASVVVIYDVFQTGKIAPEDQQQQTTSDGFLQNQPAGLSSAQMLQLTQQTLFQKQQQQQQQQQQQLQQQQQQQLNNGGGSRSNKFIQNGNTGSSQMLSQEPGQFQGQSPGGSENNFGATNQPFRRKILRTFDSQGNQNSPMNDKDCVMEQQQQLQQQQSQYQLPSKGRILAAASGGSTPSYSQLQSQQQQQHSNSQQQSVQQQQQQQLQLGRPSMNTNSPASNLNNNNNMSIFKYDMAREDRTSKKGGYLKFLIKDIGEESEVFEDNVTVYERSADFIRDCIDSFRVMVRQKEFHKFDDASTKKFLRYCTKVRFNISELCEQFRNFEKSIEKRLYWKSVMAHSAMGTLNFNSASKYAMQDVHNQTMYASTIAHQDSSEGSMTTETRKQRIGRLQNLLSDKFNFSKRQTQTRESKVELNNYKFEAEKQLLMDSHLSKDEIQSVVADNRRKLALQRLRNPFNESFLKLKKKTQLSSLNPNQEQQNQDSKIIKKKEAIAIAKQLHDESLKQKTVAIQHLLKPLRRE